MSSSNCGTGRYVASEKDVYFKPRYVATQSRYSIIFCHGSTASALTALAANGPGTPTLLRTLADRGYNILVCDLGSSLTNWGNSEAMSRMDSAFTYATSTLGFRASKVHLLGESMGHVVALRWAASNASKVASIVGVLPAYDMQAIRVNASGAASNTTLKGQIDTAWGVTYPTALPAGSNPPDLTASLTGIPWRGWYVSDDVAEFVTGATDCATALSGQAISLGTGGHTDASIGLLKAGTVAGFISVYD